MQASGWQLKWWRSRGQGPPGDHAAAVLGDQVLVRRAPGTAQVLFQIAAQVLQHVAVGAAGGRTARALISSRK